MKTRQEQIEQDPIEWLEDIFDTIKTLCRPEEDLKRNFYPAKSFPKFWLMKSSGRVLKEDKGNLYIWSSDSKRWIGEPSAVLADQIKHNNIIELQHPFRGNT